VESGDRTDADRLEEEWEHALDKADEAVAAGRRSRTIDPSDAAAEGEHIRDHRRWLRDFRPSLRRLFPRRRED
jgi:hypothetical protein